MAISQDMSWQIINQAWTKAEALNEQLQDRMDAAQTATSWSGGGFVAATVAPIESIAMPSVTIPLEAQGPDMTLFNEYNDNIIDKLVALFSGYIADNFPTNIALYSAAEAWVQNQIQNGGSGVNAAIEQQLFERASCPMASGRLMTWWPSGRASCFRCRRA